MHLYTMEGIPRRWIDGKLVGGEGTRYPSVGGCP